MKAAALYDESEILAAMAIFDNDEQLQWNCLSKKTMESSSKHRHIKIWKDAHQEAYPSNGWAKVACLHRKNRVKPATIGLHKFRTCWHMYGSVGGPPYTRYIFWIS